jgi:hypothetical protein
LLTDVQLLETTSLGLVIRYSLIGFFNKIITAFSSSRQFGFLETFTDNGFNIRFVNPPPCFHTNRPCGAGFGVFSLILIRLSVCGVILYRCCPDGSQVILQQLIW